MLLFYFKKTRITPMKLNKQRRQEIIENVEVIDAGAEGNSVAKHNDLVIFIPFVVPGDIVDVQILKKKKNFAEGKAINFHHYSDKRTEQKCPHFGLCGGCKWQTMQYEDQLFFKNKQVIDNLQRIGHIDCSKAEKIIGSEKTFFYRNKLEFTFSTKRWLSEEDIKTLERGTNKNGFGFHVPSFFDKVLDINYCALQREPSNLIRNFIKDYSQEKQLSYYNIREHIGLLRNLIIRTTSHEDMMIILVFAEESNEIFPMLDAIAKEFPQITSLMYAINTKFNDTLFDQDIICYKGKDHIIEFMPPFKEEKETLKFKIGPKSFYQTNSEQAYILYSKAAELADFKEEDILYDLYTGTGTIANFVAPYVKKVVAIESIEEAIIDAKVNSKENSISNTHFYAGDMAKILDENFVKENGKPDIIITDPPRAGMHPSVVEQLLNIEAKKIIYISCNPATQARDVNMLMEKYSVNRIQPVDMFPHTQHVENIIELCLK